MSQDYGEIDLEERYSEIEEILSHLEQIAGERDLEDLEEEVDKMENQLERIGDDVEALESSFKGTTEAADKAFSQIERRLERITEDFEQYDIDIEINETRKEISRRELIAGGLGLLGTAIGLGAGYEATHGVDFEARGYEDVEDVAYSFSTSENDRLSRIGSMIEANLVDEDRKYVVRLTDYYEDGTRIDDYRIELESRGAEEEWEIDQEVYRDALQELDS